MSYLVKRFFIFICVLCFLLGSVFVSFRCGYRQGLEEAPRHFYSVDVANALRNNASFRSFVEDIYRKTYIQVLDSVIRTDKVMGIVGGWLDRHPDCQIKSEVRRPVESGEVEKVFYKGVKF